MKYYVIYDKLSIVSFEKLDEAKAYVEKLKNLGYQSFVIYGKMKAL